MRAFIAIELPKEVRKEIVKMQKEVDKLGLVKGKFIEEENLHLTLKFLGDISRSELDAVKERLERIKFSSFKIKLDGIGVFSEDFVRIIWVSLSGEEIFELQKKIDKELEEIFAPEHRFMAHITLARPKFVEDKETLINEIKKINFNKEEFEVNRIFLKKSELTSKGPVYSNLVETVGAPSFS